MNNNQKLTKKENFIQGLKFLLFSISAGVIQIVAATICLELFKLPTWLSYFIALTLSVLWNFTLNREFTFKSANNVKIAMLKVALFYVAFAPLSTLWTNFFTSKGANKYLVLAVTMILNFVLEFLYCRFFVYRGSINTKESKKIKKD